MDNASAPLSKWIWHTLTRACYLCVTNVGNHGTARLSINFATPTRLSFFYWLYNTRFSGSNGLLSRLPFWRVFYMAQAKAKTELVESRNVCMVASVAIKHIESLKTDLSSLHVILDVHYKLSVVMVDQIPPLTCTALRRRYSHSSSTRLFEYLVLEVLLRSRDRIDLRSRNNQRILPSVC